MGRPPTTPLVFAVAASALLVALRWPFQLHRLLVEPGFGGAIDLILYREFTLAWLGGEVPSDANPPATYLLLWPFVGWLSVGAARAFWLLHGIAALVGLAVLAARAVPTRRPLDVAFLVLFLLASYAPPITVGNGQWTFHVLLAVSAACLLLESRPAAWSRDAAAAGLLAFGLAKFHLTLPFWWVAATRKGGLRAVTLAAIGYTLVSLAATTFQETGLLVELLGWIERGARASRWPQSYSNVHAWLGAAGIEGVVWVGAASITVLGLLGGWTYVHRRADLWTLLGVTAVVTRFWTYHRPYDDVLFLFPLVALVRLGWRGDRPALLAAGALWTVMMIPGWALTSGWAIGTALRTGQTIVWLAVLGLLAHRAQTASGNPSG